MSEGEPRGHTITGADAPQEDATNRNASADEKTSSPDPNARPEHPDATPDSVMPEPMRDTPPALPETPTHVGPIPPEKPKPFWNKPLFGRGPLEIPPINRDDREARNRVREYRQEVKIDSAGDMHDRVQSIALAMIANIDHSFDNRINGQQEVDDRAILADFASQNPEEFNKIMREATLAANLESNLDAQEQKMNEKYGSMVLQRVKHWSASSKPARMLSGMVAGILGRSAVSTAVLMGAGSALGAAPLAVIGSAVAGGAAGAVSGYMRGKDTYNRQHLTTGALRNEFGIDKLIQDTETLPKGSDGELAQKEHYDKVRDALAKYEEIERNKLVSGGETEIREFYNDKARLQHILEARSIRSEYRDTLTDSERAQALTRAIDNGQRNDVNRFKGTLSDNAQEFVKNHKQARGKESWGQARKQAFRGALVGGIAGALLSPYLDSQIGDYHEPNFQAAGGGHWSGEAAQLHAINDSEFTKIAEYMADNRYADAITQADKFGVGVDRGTMMEIQGLINKHDLTGEEAQKAIYNLLSYAKPDPNNLPAGYESVADYQKALFEHFGADKNALIDASAFRNWGPVQEMYLEYTDKLNGLVEVLRPLGHDIPIDAVLRPDAAAALESAIGIGAGVLPGVFDSTKPPEGKPDEKKAEDKKKEEGGTSEPDKSDGTKTEGEKEEITRRAYESTPEDAEKLKEELLNKKVKVSFTKGGKPNRPPVARVENLVLGNQDYFDKIKSEAAYPNKKERQKCNEAVAALGENEKIERELYVIGVKFEPSKEEGKPGKIRFILSEKPATPTTPEPDTTGPDNSTEPAVPDAATTETEDPEVPDAAEDTTTEGDSGEVLEEAEEDEEPASGDTTTETDEIVEREVPRSQEERAELYRNELVGKEVDVTFVKGPIDPKTNKHKIHNGSLRLGNVEYYTQDPYHTRIWIVNPGTRNAMSNLIQDKDTIEATFYVTKVEFAPSVTNDEKTEPERVKITIAPAMPTRPETTPDTTPKPATPDTTPTDPDNPAPPSSPSEPKTPETIETEQRFTESIDNLIELGAVASTMSDSAEDRAINVARGMFRTIAGVDKLSADKLAEIYPNYASLPAHIQRLALSVQNTTNLAEAMNEYPPLQEACDALWNPPAAAETTTPSAPETTPDAEPAESDPAAAAVPEEEENLEEEPTSIDLSPERLEQIRRQNDANEFVKLGNELYSYPPDVPEEAQRRLALGILLAQGVPPELVKDVNRDKALASEGSNLANLADTAIKGRSQRERQAALRQVINGLLPLGEQLKAQAAEAEGSGS